MDLKIIERLSAIVAMLMFAPLQVRSGALYEVVLNHYEALPNECCDGIRNVPFGVLKCNECDPYFIICLQALPSGVNQCIRTSRENNIHSQDLANGNIRPNHIQQRVAQWEGSLLVDIDIRDYDSVSSDDDIDHLRHTYTGPADRQARILVFKGQRVSLSVSITVQCEPDYYGDNCTRHCLNSTISFCDTDGNIIPLSASSSTISSIVRHNSTPSTASYTSDENTSSPYSRSRFPLTHPISNTESHLENHKTTNSGNHGLSRHSTHSGSSSHMSSDASGLPPQTTGNYQPTTFKMPLPKTNQTFTRIGIWTKQAPSTSELSSQLPSTFLTKSDEHINLQTSKLPPQGSSHSSFSKTSTISTYPTPKPITYPVPPKRTTILPLTPSISSKTASTSMATQASTFPSMLTALISHQTSAHSMATDHNGDVDKSPSTPSTKPVTEGNGSVNKPINVPLSVASTLTANADRTTYSFTTSTTAIFSEVTSSDDYSKSTEKLSTSTADSGRVTHIYDVTTENDIQIISTTTTAQDRIPEPTILYINNIMIEGFQPDVRNDVISALKVAMCNVKEYNHTNLLDIRVLSIAYTELLDSGAEVTDVTYVVRFNGTVLMTAFVKNPEMTSALKEQLKNKNLQIYEANSKTWMEQHQLFVITIPCMGTLLLFAIGLSLGCHFRNKASCRQPSSGNKMPMTNYPDSKEYNDNFSFPNTLYDDSIDIMHKDIPRHIEQSLA